MNTEVFLNNLIKEVRSIIKDDKMINKCDLVQGIIGNYLKLKNIEIHPCNTQKQISSRITGHSFIVAKLNDEYYLIDPTFVQFKYLNEKDLYIQNIRCISNSPYYYANIIDKNGCQDLIKKGYMKLTEQNAYWYGNCFYRTMTGINKDYTFMNINGKIIINSFTKANESLSENNNKEFNIHKKK